MTSRLRPTAPVATDAILVGDPGRALLLAQELLEQPRMSNHARGLWGYSGETPAGRGLTIQATGMGGPSAAIVLADLATLGVRRAIRVGTCTGLAPEVRAGDLVVVAEAIAGGGSAAAYGVEVGDSVLPDPELFGRLRESLGKEASPARIESHDAHPVEPGPTGEGTAAAADMQTVAVLARSRELEVAAAALLIVSDAGGAHLEDDRLESASKRAGAAARDVLST
jgi:uridine phosphorylase